MHFTVGYSSRDWSRIRTFVEWLGFKQMEQLLSQRRKIPFFTRMIVFITEFFQGIDNRFLPFPFRRIFSHVEKKEVAYRRDLIAVYCLSTIATVLRVIWENNSRDAEYSLDGGMRVLGWRKRREEAKNRLTDNRTVVKMIFFEWKLYYKPPVIFLRNNKIR